MKAVAALCLVASARAFVAPQAAVHTSSAMTMSAAPESRRAVIQTVFTTAAAAVAAAAIPELAFADGAVSDATVQRAKGIYGDKVLALGNAVKAGDFAAVAEGKNSITLLVSGGFAQASKADKKAAAALKSAIFTAIDTKNAAALQSAYSDLVKLAKIPATTGGGETQGYSSDYDWKARTSKGTIYVR